jgi:hypothetical protein
MAYAGWRQAAFNQPFRSFSEDLSLLDESAKRSMPEA